MSIIADSITGPDGARSMPEVRLVYTVREAAEELRIGYSTARERIRSGELRSFKDGGRRLVAGSDLLAYIEARMAEGF